MISALTGFDPDRVTELAGIRMLEGDVTDLNGGGVVSQLLIVAVIVAAAGLIAGVAPARRGADLPVLEAIAHA